MKKTRFTEPQIMAPKFDSSGLILRMVAALL